MQSHSLQINLLPLKKKKFGKFRINKLNVLQVFLVLAFITSVTTFFLLNNNNNNNNNTEVHPNYEAISMESTDNMHEFNEIPSTRINQNEEKIINRLMKNKLIFKSDTGVCYEIIHQNGIVLSSEKVNCNNLEGGIYD